jgi:preprotein translocase subunit Sec63
MPSILANQKCDLTVNQRISQYYSFILFLFSIILLGIILGMAINKFWKKIRNERNSRSHFTSADSEGYNRLH